MESKVLDEAFVQQLSHTGFIQLRLNAAYLRSSLNGLLALLCRCEEERDANLPLLGMKACRGINVPLSPELFTVLKHEDKI